MSPRIAVLGSCTFDIIFTLPRLPSAGETLIAHSVGVFPGGKGLNQSIACARLGAEAAAIGRVGLDAFGEELLAMLIAEGVDVSAIARDPANGSGVAVPIVVPGGDNAILAAPRANLAMTLADLEPARRLIEAADAFLIQFETPMEVNLAAMRIARAAGVRTILNPAPILPAPEEIFTLAEIIVVNEVEAAMLAPGAGPDPLEQAREILRRGPSVVIVTLGPAGGLGLGAASEAIRFPAFAVQAVDTVGAGDAFCGGLAVALSERRSLADALTFASATAALSVTRSGAAPSYPARAEVESLLARGAVR